MKVTITKPDGTRIDAEGSADEIRGLLTDAPKAPATPDDSPLARLAQEEMQRRLQDQYRLQQDQWLRARRFGGLHPYDPLVTWCVSNGITGLSVVQ